MEASLSNTSSPGITGDLSFSGGRRTSLQLQVRTWDPVKRIARHIGDWTSHHGLNITDNKSLEISHKGGVSGVIIWCV